MERLWMFFVEKRSFTILVTIALILAGLYSVIAIPKESSPEVEVPLVIATTILPGSSAEDVEALVTNPIEDRLIALLDDADSITSSSQAGVSSITIQFEASKGVDEAVADVKDIVDATQGELPGDAEQTIVSKIDFTNQPILTVSISAPKDPLAQVELAERVEADLESVAGVSDVVVRGAASREIGIFVIPERLALYDLTLDQVYGAVRASLSPIPAGSLETSTGEFSLSFDARATNAEDLQSVAVSFGEGRTVYLRDVADISDGVTEKSTISRLSIEGQPAREAISFDVYKQSGENITSLSRSVREEVSRLQENELKGVDVLISFDSGEFIERDLSNLTVSGLQTIALVGLVLLFGVGWKEAVVAALAIPLSFIIAFIGLYVSGNTINFTSLFSLILAIGILVDTAIVVTEAISENFQKGMNLKEAADQTILEFGWPLAAGTATTIAVFFPLFFLSGITGEFIKSIPFTIVSVLIASFVVAMGIVPTLMILALKRGGEGEIKWFHNIQANFIPRIEKWYRAKLFSYLENEKKGKRFVRILVASFFLSLLLPVFGLVEVVFFPQDDIGYLYIEVESPTGASLEETLATTELVESGLYDIPEIDSFITTVGSGSVFSMTGGSGSNISNTTIILKELEDRERSSSEIMLEIREHTDAIQSADVRVSEPSSGPPVGAAVSVSVRGEEFDDIEAAAFEVEELLGSIEGVVDITSEARDVQTGFALSLQEGRSLREGVSEASVGQAVRAALFGLDAGDISVDGKDRQVRIFLGERDQTFAEIQALQVPTQGESARVGSVARFDVERSRPVIRHDDGERVFTVSSAITPGTNLAGVIGEFNTKLENASFPEGVEVQVGGETEEQNQSFVEMVVALLAGLILIAAVLVLQFNSFRQMLLIISIVPLSLIGVFVGLALAGKTLSFPSILGFIALAGVVVNNAIILIDVMNSLRDKHPDWPLEKVALEGATSRLRPILLTTLTTVIGMIPLIFASELWAPLAYAIMFGLTFAVVITLILVPIRYIRQQR